MCKPHIASRVQYRTRRVRLSEIDQHGHRFTILFEMFKIVSQCFYMLHFKLKCPDRCSVVIHQLRICNIYGQGPQSDDLLERFPVALLIAAAIPPRLVVDWLSGTIPERNPVAGSTAGHSGIGYVKGCLAAYFHPVFTGKKKPRKLRGFVPN